MGRHLKTKIYPSTVYAQQLMTDRNKRYWDLGQVNAKNPSIVNCVEFITYGSSSPEV